MAWEMVKEFINIQMVISMRVVGLVIWNMDLDTSFTIMESFIWDNGNPKILLDSIFWEEKKTKLEYSENILKKCYN